MFSQNFCIRIVHCVTVYCVTVDVYSTNPPACRRRVYLVLTLYVVEMIAKSLIVLQSKNILGYISG